MDCTSDVLKIWTCLCHLQLASFGGRRHLWTFRFDCTWCEVHCEHCSLNRAMDWASTEKEKGSIPIPPVSAKIATLSFASFVEVHLIRFRSNCGGPNRLTLRVWIRVGGYGGQPGSWEGWKRISNACQQEHKQGSGLNGSPIQSFQYLTLHLVKMEFNVKYCGTLNDI